MPKTTYRNERQRSARALFASAFATLLLVASVVPATLHSPVSAEDLPTEEAPALVKPDETNTGPRLAEADMPVITTAQAITILCRDKVLSGYKVTGMLKISNDSCAKEKTTGKAASGAGINWLIQDCIIEARDGTYGVQTYVSLKPFAGTLAERPVFDHVTVRGGAVTGNKSTSALFYGTDAIWRFSNLYGGIDNLKPLERVVVEDSYSHSLDRPVGAHSDVVQIRKGKDMLFERNNFVAIVAYGEGIGGNGNGVLQTGSMEGLLTNTVWRDNWFNGGGYTIRANEPNLGYTFEGNKFGRTFTYKPYLGSTSYLVGDTNVWEDTGTSILLAE